VRTATCLEYNVKDATVKLSDITLTSSKSGFGALMMNGKNKDIYSYC